MHAQCVIQVYDAVFECTRCAGCEDEQAAARVLGYSQASWDNESGQETQPASSEKYWAQLTHDERAAAGVLGFTDPTWDEQPAATRKAWAQLTEYEQQAARALGYVQLSWDKYSRHEGQLVLIARTWAQLTQLERAAAAVLGYTEQRWDGTAPKSTAANKKWNELTSCG